MISGREAALAVSGAVRLARFDAKGAYFFNATVQGFWNSFWVAAVIAPVHILYIALIWQNEDIPTTALRFFSIETIMYVMNWVAFPLAMVTVSKWLDRRDRFLTFGTANNWTDLVVSALVLPVQIAITTDLLTGTALSFALAVAIVYSLGVSWFVSRHTLNISGLAASGVIALAVFINFIIRYWGAVLIAG